MIANVSIAVPCYNASPYLPQLMEAIRRQTVAYHEILFYDDHSTDDTWAALQQISHADARVRIFRGTRQQGVSYARNLLAARATSELIHFQDADDSMKPTFVERHLADRRGEEVTFCDFEEWSTDGASAGVHQYEPDQAKGDPIAFCIEHWVNINTMLIPRTLAMAVGGFPYGLRHGEDRLFVLKLALSGVRIRYIREDLSRWHRNLTCATALTSVGDRVQEQLRTRTIMKELVPEKYWPVLGEDMAVRAWDALTAGDLLTARRGFRFAAGCGARTLKGQGKGLRAFTSALGLEWGARLYHVLRHGVARPAR
jgi:glycosyltransferase involved in cell wall biosynthesis